MIAETGHFALVLAFCVALVHGVLPLFGAARGHAGLMMLAPGAALAQTAMVMIAFAAPTSGYVRSDFSILNVFENSHSLKPLL